MRELICILNAFIIVSHYFYADYIPHLSNVGIHKTEELIMLRYLLDIFLYAPMA